MSDPVTRWYSCAILGGAWIPDEILAEPTNFAGGVKLERIPKWVQDEKALEYESWLTRKSVSEARGVLAVEYDADSLGAPDPEWRGSQPRAIQAAAAEKIALAQLALWIACPFGWATGHIVHFSRIGDASSVRQSGSLERAFVQPEHVDASPTAQKLAVASRVHREMLSLRRDGNVWIALRMLILAATERLWDVRFILLWVVLEGLYGPADGREISYRLAQRIAFFLGQDRVEARTLYALARDCYTTRSKAVHGARLSGLSEEKSAELITASEAFARSTFLRILLDAELAASFDGKARETFLDQLVFG